MNRQLRDFSISNFRVLERLDISELGTINLFVGKNNTGKTTILEALRVYLSSDPTTTIFQILSNREEYRFSRKNLATIDVTGEDSMLSFESIFSGRPSLNAGPSFSLGPISEAEKNKLTIQVVWLRRERDEETSTSRLQEIKEYEEHPDVVPGFKMMVSGKPFYRVFDRINQYSVRRKLESTIDQNVVYLPSSGLTMREIGETWDSIALTDDEDEVVEALRIIAPNLEKIVLVQTPQRTNQRMLMVKLSNFQNPAPFKSLGEGTIHFLGLILAIIQARNGAVLLDEVEHGVHYSIQERMWKLVMDQASKFNVQVFATTHSLDCVRGFQAAAADSVPIKARLFRLEQNATHIRSVAFSASEVSIATSEGIEIR